MMSPEQQHKEIEERLRAWLGEDRMGGVGPRRDYIAPELWPDLVAVWANAFHWFSALDAAEAMAKAAEERVRELEGKITAIVKWLEENQADVFRRGFWDALKAQGSGEL